MITYTLDTNIITYLLKGDQTVLDNYLTATKEGKDFTISPMAYYEVKRGLSAIKAIKKISYFNTLYSQYDNVDFDIRVWDKATEIYIDLKKKGRPIGDADILIGAYCLINDFTLVTNNEVHFKCIKGLKVENWKNN